MARCIYHEPNEDPTGLGLVLVLLFCFGWSSQADRPSFSSQFVWKLIGRDGKVIVEDPLMAPQPLFIFDLCDLFGPNWDGRNCSSSTTTDGGCSTIDRERRLQEKPYTFCNKEDRPTSCEEETHYFCGDFGESPPCIPAWGSITDPHIEFLRTDRGTGGTCTLGDCNPMTIRVKDYDNLDTWTKGRTWVIRVIFTKRDPGTNFTIRLDVLPRAQDPIGPLRTTPSLQVTLGLDSTVKPSTTHLTDLGACHPNDLGPVHPRVKPLVRSMELMYHLLNDSAPNVTRDCWLCLHPEPPYYICIAAIAEVGTNKGDIRKLTLSSGNLNSPECKWGTQLHQVTLEDVQGKGTCLITANYKLDASSNWGHCTQTIRVSKTQEWAVLLKALEGTWWVCTSGIIPSVYLYGMAREEFCILTHILPHLYYAHGGRGWAHLERQENGHLWPMRQKRAPIIVPILAGAAIAGSIAVGATTLAKEETMVKLDQQVDQDLRTLEDSMEALEGSLSSLAEVVLQNRRGLDLLFLKQGGLCVALNEACCFYANHSGMVKKNLSEVKKRIEDRAQKWKELSEGNWFKGNWFTNRFSNLFSWPSWVKTLISTIAGPLITSLLIITLGPCLWKTLVSMIQRRTRKVMHLEEAGGYIDYFDTEEEREEEESRI
ncbi:endogenous retrovirus group S71 member 1 Env polyprotein-like [Erinaceus europaeus]|uniref:Endogenous retrovirus group S71 member 1 Env polyprotein-like n=1 Tax=Erinaceus europaeus TaxID=9365 RepID=A0ABM3Y509_ERIEU|nr:endogenous retrovirus group S71 member 1 Env polyprotein-like [Erinaceus europaeus]XP_060056161.1 endogenous retrovirus group S71 member 1 Env polyprotein-like [Erinaceus europaeus]